MDVAGVSIGTGSGTLYDGNERVIGFSVGRSLNSMVSTGDSTGVENGLLDARRSRFVDFGDGVGRMRLIRIRIRLCVLYRRDLLFLTRSCSIIFIPIPVNT